MSHSQQEAGAGLPPHPKHPDCTTDGHAAASNGDPTAELKQGLEATRLPPDLKTQILAELPSAEERERLYRELQQNGGLSSEEFFASLDLSKGERQP